jgi:hypothetical protein
VSGWRSAPICLISGSKIVNDRDEVLAVAPRPGLRELLTAVFRPGPIPPVTAPDGTPLFSYETKVGSFKNWLKIYGPDHRLIVRIDQIGNLFTAMKRRYTIRDATGTEIGRIDNPRLGHEFLVLDGDGTPVARGIRRGQEGWEISRPAVRDSPWPEIAAAFFMSGIGTARQGSSV